MGRRSIFLSSTTRDLQAHRDAAAEAIEKAGYACVRMEDFGAYSAAPADLIAERLRDCEVVIAIVGHVYGSCPPGSDTSFTELEWTVAKRLQKTYWAFLAPDTFPVPAALIEPDAVRARQQRFRASVSNEVVRETFDTPVDLARKIARALDRRRSTSGSVEPIQWAPVRPHYLDGVVRQFASAVRRYTDLRLTTDIRVASYKGHRIRKAADKRQWSFREALALRPGEDHPGFECVVVLGDPGAGKTTLCQRTALDLAREAAGRGAAGATHVPVYVELAGYGGQLFTGTELPAHQRMLTFLAREIDRVLTPTPVTTHVSWATLEEYLKQDRFCFFLDGANETPAAQRQTLFTDLKAFVSTFRGRGHQFVITTRKTDYEYEIVPHLPTDDYHPLEILELDSSGVSEFVVRHLTEYENFERILQALSAKRRGEALEIVRSHLVDPSQADGAAVRRLFDSLVAGKACSRAVADRLVKGLGDAAGLSRTLRHPDHARVLWLAQNPATLKDVIDVYQQDGAIPKSRTKLFERAIQVRMQAQAGKPGEKSGVPEEQKFGVLEAIAMRMMDPGVGLRMPRSAIFETMDTALPAQPDELRTKLLSELVFDDAILVESEEGVYGFIKQPYQEYFVARRLAHRWRNALRSGSEPLHDGQIADIVKARTNWQVASGMVGLLEPHQADDVVRRLRKRPGTRRLAAICVRQAAGLQSDTIQSFMEWTRARILSFAYLPERLSQLVAMLGWAMLLSLSLNRDLFDPRWPSLLVSGPAAVAASMGPALGYWLPLAAQEVLLVGLAVGGWALKARTPANADEDPLFTPAAATWLLIGAGSLGPAFTVLGAGAGIWGLLARTASLASILIAAMRLIRVSVVRWSRAVNASIEEAVIRRYLIGYLEIMRDMGPDAASAIIELQERFMSNKYMSDRIKDAVYRTWVLSPKSVFQALEQINQPERRAEAVRVLEAAIVNDQTDAELRDKAVNALVGVVSAPAESGVGLAIVHALERVAEEQRVYADLICKQLRPVVTSPRFALRMRQAAWGVLHKHGVRDVAWPGSRLPRAAVVTLILVVAMSLWLLSRTLT